MSIWRSIFWRSYWIALQRSGEDKRARLLALKVSILLFCFWVNVLYWLFFLRELGEVWPFASYAAIFGAALLTRFFINRSHRRQDELLSYPLTGGHGLTPAGTVYVSQAVWNYLEERMLILVSPLARAASEIYIQRNELDAGTEVGHVRPGVRFCVRQDYGKNWNR
jgi:hypothetical protein